MIVLGQTANDQDAQSDDTWNDEPTRVWALDAQQIAVAKAAAGHMHNNFSRTAEQGGDTGMVDEGAVETIVRTATAGPVLATAR